LAENAHVAEAAKAFGVIGDEPEPLQPKVNKEKGDNG
jgi:hypothetical protein